MAVVDGVNTATPQTWYVATDHLHRPIRMTNAAKAVMWSATWTPWGAPHAITGAAVLDARFPGQWFQIESSLHYNWHRHYDPTLGRYTQPDPLGFVDGQSVYGYAVGSPGMAVDPDGQNATLIKWGGYAGQVAGAMSPIPGGAAIGRVAGMAAGAGIGYICEMARRPRGERGATAGSSGANTDNPYKHCREISGRPHMIECRNHQTGKWTEKPKPKDWDDYKKKGR